MAKQETNWEPDVRKGLEDMKNMQDINQKLKDDADHRKIDGFNPGDVGQK